MRAALTLVLLVSCTTTAPLAPQTPVSSATPSRSVMTTTEPRTPPPGPTFPGAPEPSSTPAQPQVTATRSEFGFSFIDAVADGRHGGPRGSTLYRFRVDIEIGPGDPTGWNLHLPSACRRELPHNCPWQLASGVPVLELYVSGVPEGAHPISLTLPDGRSAQTLLLIGAPAAAGVPLATTAPSGPPATDATASPRTPAPTATSLPALATRFPRPASVPATALRLLADFAGPDSRQSSSGVADASVAAGINEIIVAANDVAAIFDRSGSMIDLRQLPQTFRQYVADDEWVGDARVAFDHRAARYFLTVATTPRGGRCFPFNDCANKWLLAVSKDARPRTLGPAAWHVYSFDGRYERGQRARTFGDFTVTSSNDESVVLTGQVIDDSGESYAKIWVFDKAQLLRGDPVAAPASEFTRPKAADGRVLTRALPAVMFGEAPAVFMASWTPGSCGVTILGVSGPPSSASLTVRDAAASGNCSAPPNATQPDGAPLHVAASVTSPPVFRGGSLWVTHNVARGLPSGTVGEVRIVEINVRSWPAAATVLSDTRLSEEGVHYSYPAIAVSDAHDLAVVAARSSASEHASVYFTGRLATDPIGTLRPPVLLRAGVSAKNCSDSVSGRTTRNRFADFSGASIDPAGGSAWIVAEYAFGTERCAWGTWVGRIDWNVSR